MKSKHLKIESKQMASTSSLMVEERFTSNEQMQLKGPKLGMTLLLLFLILSYYSQAQLHWTTTLMDASTSEAKLGTISNTPLNLYTSGTKKLIIDTNGAVKITRLAGSGPSILMIDANGIIGRAVGGGGGPITCGAGIVPWVIGGNNVTGQLNGNLIGTCNNYDFVLQANSKKSVFIKTSGYVGIGENNSSPAAALDISDPAYSNTEHLVIHGDQWGSIEATAQMNLIYNADFTINKGTYFTGFGPVFKIDNTGRTGIGTNYTLVNKLTVDAGAIDGIQTRISNSTAKALSVYNTANAISNFVVYGDGKTTISPSNATALVIMDPSNSNKINFKINKNGFAYAREINVMPANITFPDYVFSNSYSLLSIDKLEEFISENKHLPNIPSAKIIEAEGLNIGEMQIKQMEKIEEAFLYIIQLKKENDDLKKRLQNLENK